MKKPILILGCGGHSKAIIDILETSQEWSIYGLIGLPKELDNLVLGYRVIGTDDDLERLRAECKHIVLAIGQIGVNDSRLELSKRIEALGFSFPAIVSSNAYVSPYARVGDGTSIGHGVVVNASASIGRFCIINSNSTIEHDSWIGDFSHISTGALINGGVKIGKGSFIGSGTMIREGIALPSRCTISAGKRIMGWPLRD